VKKVCCILLLVVLLQGAACAQTMDDFSQSEQAVFDSAQAQRDATIVWVSPFTKAYHARQDCAQLVAPYQMTRGEADAASRTPCETCFSQASAGQDVPFYRLSVDAFLSRYNAIAASQTTDSAPYLQASFSNQDATLYTTPFAYLSIYTRMDDADDCVKGVIVAFDAFAMTVQRTALGDGGNRLDPLNREEVRQFALACEFTVMASDPTLDKAALSAILTETILRAMREQVGEDDILYAERNGIFYAAGSIQVNNDKYYYFAALSPL
jgi:hypothetical protein